MRWLVSMSCALLVLAPGAGWAQQSGEEEQESLPLAAPEPAHQESEHRAKPGRDRTPQEMAYNTDERGRRFRTGFPLYNRFIMEANTGALPSRTGRGVRDAGVRLRMDLSTSLDFADEEVWWKMRHSVLETTLARVHGDQGVRVQGALVDARYLRHDLSAFIVVPTLNDLRVPANFDIAVDYTLLGYDVRWGGGEVDAGTLELVDMALLIDFIRDETYRHRLAIGLASWYHPTPGPTWTHSLSPLTAAKLLYGWDHKAGLFRIYTEATCGGALGFSADTQAEQVWQWGCRASLLTEWTPLAISDWPLSLPLEVHAELPLSGERTASINATLGIRLSIPTL